MLTKMEKKVYVVWRSCKGSKEIAVITDSLTAARAWVRAAYDSHACCEVKFNFRIQPFDADTYYTPFEVPSYIK